jgi:hypothetical protein
VADAVSGDAEPSALQPAEHAPPAQAKPTLRTSGLHLRFGAAYLVLAALVGAALGFFIVFLGGHHGSGGSSWSTFTPKDRGEAAAPEIAQHVQSRYRLPSGNSLVSVFNRDPSLQSGSNTFPIGAIEVEPATKGLSATAYRTDHTLFYALCGVSASSNCAIPGKATAARLELLRREILELALYSFKYGGADAVVTYAPPTKAKGKTLRTIAIVRREDWQPALRSPLGSTLPSRPVSMPGSLTPRERQTAKAVRLYDYRFEPLADGSLVLFAAPLQG